MEATFSERSPGSILESVRDPDRRRLRNARLITLPTRGSQKLRSRSVLFSEGDPATEVFEVVKGAVMVLRPLSGGRRQILDVVGPGRMVGFTARPAHDCTAVALATTQVIAFDRRNALGRRQGGMDFNVAVMAEIDRLGDGEGPQVVRLLLSRQEIADHLGLVLETVSRSFLALKQRGVIARAGRTSVTVLDCLALRQIAAGDGETFG